MKYFFYKEIDSTQTEVWRRIKNKSIQNGTIIVAEKQTNGIGTHARTWYTDEENNIAFSMYFSPKCNIDKFKGLTVDIAKIIVEIFEKNYKIQMKIKYPNDIYCNGKKVGGILTQTSIKGEIAIDLVIGIGINTNKRKFNDEIVNIATSIKKEFDITIDNNLIIKQICEQIEKRIGVDL